MAVIWGRAGFIESSTKVRGAEHGETLPAASCAVALNEVVVLLATEPVRPGEANLAAEPTAAGVPVQAAVL